VIIITSSNKLQVGLKRKKFKFLSCTYFLCHVRKHSEDLKDLQKRTKRMTSKQMDNKSPLSRIDQQQGSVLTNSLKKDKFSIVCIVLVVYGVYKTSIFLLCVCVLGTFDF
jgi:hypothetical protein